MQTRSGESSLWPVDFEQAPFIAIWEITRACDLACRHCRAEAISRALPGELSSQEGFSLLEELSKMGTPICVLSGGDPAKRNDLCELVRYGAELGMRMATIPAATALLTRRLMDDLKHAGLSQLALSLDGPNARSHDNFRGVPGSFGKTLVGARYARQAGLPLQINTTFSSHNARFFDQLAALVESLGIVFWEVFFLVPTGRGRQVPQLNASDFEELFGRLADLACRADFIVKVTEAPHFRRHLMPQRAPKTPELGSVSENGGLPFHMRRDFGPAGSIGLAPRGVNSGKGHLFISYRGDIYPSGFLPLACGNCRTDRVAEVYRKHPVFRDLRDPDRLKGRCGICEFRHVCGGSRARAFAMTGDYLEEEPFCIYSPHKTC